MMRGNHGRKPTIWDALIVVAATASALVMAGNLLQRSYFSVELEFVIDYLFLIRRVLYLMAHVVAAWSPALLIIRLRRPRPSLLRLARQPGMMATTVATVVLGIRLMNLLSVRGVLGLESSRELVPSEVGCAVAAAWTIQVLGGRWRPERSWIDRAGRLLGAFWIVTTPFAWISFVMAT